MGKAIGIIATITAGVALAATGVGAIALPGLAGSLSVFGVSTSTLFLASTGLSILAGYLNKPKAGKPSTTEQSKRQSIPARVKARGRMRLYGAYMYYGNGTDGSAVDVLAFMDGPSDGNEILYINDDRVTITGGFVNAVEKKYQGNNVQAGLTLGAVPNIAFPAVSAKVPTWTPSHRGDGICTGYLIKRLEKEKYFTETYPQGDATEMSRVDRWGLFYDFRDSAQNIADNPERPDMWVSGNYIGSWKWTENAVIHTFDMLVFEQGYDYETRILPTLDYWITAANICDEAVPLKAGGTEPRYRACVSYDMTVQEKEKLAAYTETFHGWIQERGDGAFVIYAGKVYTPSVTIGPDEIINISLQKKVDPENVIDQVKVTYISAEHEYTEQEATPWGGENGATRIGTMDAATPSYSQNRRLAKRIMDVTNAPRRGSVTTGLSGDVVRNHRYIYLDHSEGGVTFFYGIVEVSNYKQDPSSGLISFDFVAVDPNIDAWNPATEEGDGAPIEGKVTPAPLQPPTITSAAAVYDQSAQDATGTRISVIADSPLGNRDDLTWYLGWKKTSASVWKEDTFTDIDPGDQVNLITDFVPSDASIDLRAEYKDGSGQLSGYSAIYTLDTSTDTTAPDDAISITQTNWSDTLDLVTDYIPRARSYRWRFYGSDGTTLIRTLITSGRTVSYASQQAAVDGARRSYIVRVAGINGAGAGGEASTGTLTLTAPTAVTGVTATGGASNAEIDFTLVSGAAGYSVAFSTVANFDPLIQGTIQKSFGSPTYLQGLAAGTFYAKVAAFDAWTDRPDLLNYSTPEVSFVITTGGGGTGSGGGGGGGGYCPVADECILMADGSQKRAGDVVAGDRVWTQHEHTMKWGAFEVEAVSIVESDDVWRALGFKATAGHKTWLSGTWNRHDVIGERVPGVFKVARITVKDAHTYVCAGVLSHNIKQTQPLE